MGSPKNTGYSRFLFKNGSMRAFHAHGMASRYGHASSWKGKSFSHMMEIQESHDVLPVQQDTDSQQRLIEAYCVRQQVRTYFHYHMRYQNDYYDVSRMKPIQLHGCSTLKMRIISKHLVGREDTEALFSSRASVHLAIVSSTIQMGPQIREE